MTLQQITIEVDVPPGFKLTGEYRVPSEGDFGLSSNGEVNRWRSTCKQIILERTNIRVINDIQLPTTLWAAKDDDGEWYIYNEEPSYNNTRGTWETKTDDGVVHANFLHWEPP